MKHVVSVSLGASSRDHRHEVEILGEKAIIERRGTDGSFQRALELIRELDGKVDCIGLGGIDLYIVAAGKRYAFRDARRLAAAAKKTPVVDGSGLKNTLERRVIELLCAGGGDLSPQGRRVLLMAGVDRFGMAEALEAVGAQVTYGDLAFALGVPVPLRSLRALGRAGRILLPVITQLPFQWLYPTGSKQEANRPKHVHFFRDAEWIAGDFHYLRRYMPEDLTGRIVLTNTITPADVEDLRRRGVAVLITTTPNLGGRSFATNAMESLLVALGRTGGGARPLESLIEELDLQPRIERLNRQTASVSS